MSLPPGFLDDLRGRLSLARVAGRKVTWDARKTNAARGDYWAPCPFHQEKTPSFHVDDQKGFYYCFGCHAKGDAIGFVCATENIGFIEAVESLAGEVGIAMPERSRESREVTDRRTRLAAAMEAAVAFYRLQLNTAKAGEARAYLDHRRLAQPTRETFEIGFAPDARTALAEHLAGKGFSREEAAEAGLTLVPDDGGAPFDRFRNRIIFPIRDARGRAVALGGRALSPGARAKYLNSPQTPLFDKGRTLFNLGPARAAAGRSGRLIVVEGYMDAIALAQAGVAEVVAPLGTAITEDQLELLWRVAQEPLVALDGDPSGLDAAHRLIDLALPRLVAGRSLRFVLMPAKQDPDDVVRAGGRAAMEALIEASQPIVELIWRRETEGRNLDSPERRAALDARLRAHLGRISDDGLRAHYAAAIRERRAKLFARPPSALPARRRGFRGVAGRPPAAGRWPIAPAAASPTAKASLLGRPPDGLAAEARLRESAILFGLINHPALAASFEDRLDRMAFVCADLGEIRDALLSCLGESLDGDGGGAALAERLERRLGRDPRTQFGALGQLRVNPHIGPAADPARAALAIEEEIARHAAWTAMQTEVREAADALAGPADEGLTWRLRQAAEASHRAASEPLGDDAAEEATALSMSRHLQELIDRQIWKKPGKR